MKENKWKQKIKLWMEQHNIGWNTLIILLTALVLITVLVAFVNLKMNSDRYKGLEEVSYITFSQMVEDGLITKVKIDYYNAKLTFIDSSETEKQTDNPKIEGFKQSMLKAGIEVEEVDDNKAQNKFDKMVVSLKFLLIIGVMLFLIKSTGLGGAFGQKFVAIKPKDTPMFENVAGNEESKDELKILVDFLKNPKKYTQNGAKMPRGYLLIGPPGTGKTYLAKAVANEAHVPFYEISGSNFIEIYAGVGAKRVRGIFNAAKANAPAIIFIDEVDAIAGKRGQSGNSENDQALNQLLIELDGFDKDSNVVVIAATNRVDILDEAFKRPGRLDKHITINLPDLTDRKAILREHIKNKKIAEDVNLESIAQLTIGMSGSGIEVLVNEAAILSAVAGRDSINYDDFDNAQYKMLMKGSKKKNREETDHEKRLLAWHEAAHTVVTKLLSDNGVPKVTIVGSTAGHGGATFSIPKKLGLYTKRELYTRLKVLQAGRIGEFLFTKDEMEITTGAVNDISEATDLIKSITNDFGMSQTFGMINITRLTGSGEAIEEEVIRLSKQLYEEATELLISNHEMLKQMADALYEKETLLELEIDSIIEKYKKQEDLVD